VTPIDEISPRIRATREPHQLACIERRLSARLRDARIGCHRSDADPVARRVIGRRCGDLNDLPGEEGDRKRSFGTGETEDAPAFPGWASFCLDAASIELP